MTKPDYQHFCNQIHLHQQLVNKGRMEQEAFQTAIGTLMKQLTKSISGSKFRSYPKQRTNRERRQQHDPPRRYSTREPRQGVCGNYGIGKQGQWTEKIILGGVGTRKHYKKWQQIRRKRWGWLLDMKRDVASVAEGVSYIELTTQRLQPAPWKKKKSARACGF